MRAVRRAGVLSVIVLVTLVGLGSLRSPARAAPSHTFGAFVPAAAGSREAVLSSLESNVGRTFDTTRLYLGWDSVFPNSDAQALGQSHTLYVSVGNRQSDGSIVPWSSIANALPGSTIYNQIVSWADRLRAWGRPVYFIFNHEPEYSPKSSGTPADFVGAWRKFRLVFAAEGTTNALFTWTLAGPTFALGAAQNWYPGDDAVDLVGSDVYNHYGCKGGTPVWQSFAQLARPTVTFAADHNKGVVFPEYGSVEDPANGSMRAAWFSAMLQTLSSGGVWTKVQGLVYFDQYVTGAGRNCDYRLVSGSVAMQAFANVGSAPYFTG